MLKVRNGSRKMRKAFVISLLITGLATTYSIAQMGHGLMRGGHMMGDMNQMMQWMMGQEIKADLTGPRPLENDNTISAGRRIYERRCAVCHGERGDGKGSRAGELYTKPRDFTLGVYKYRSTPSGSLPLDEDIYTSISAGVRGTGMLPWFGLSKEEKWAVTYYIKTFSERFEEEGSDLPVAVPRVTVFPAELVDRGRLIFEQVKCRECHGKDGRGNGPKADELKDDWSYPVRPRDFTSEKFKRGASVEDIFLTVATGLDGTPMASHGDTMSARDILSVAAYVKSLAQSARREGGMMGMMNMTRDERAGMMIDHPGMSGGMMGDGMMGPGMMR
jgi:cytochrome c oxidase cbb3-type subunit 2